MRFSKYGPSSGSCDSIVYHYGLQHLLDGIAGLWSPSRLYLARSFILGNTNYFYSSSSSWWYLFRAASILDTIHTPDPLEYILLDFLPRYLSYYDFAKERHCIAATCDIFSYHETYRKR